MQTHSTYQTEKNTVLISVSGRFDLEQHKDFRAAYCEINKPNTVFRVDLSQVNYIDSSALGMLNLLRRHADSINGQTILVKPQDLVLRILKLAHFDELFVIEE